MDIISIAGPLTLVELVGDWSLKRAAVATIGSKEYFPTTSKGVVALLAGIVSYSALALIIYTSNRMGLSWGITNSYWNAINNLVTPLVFMLIFGEKYTLIQWIGFFVISVGILLVGYK